MMAVLCNGVQLILIFFLQIHGFGLEFFDNIRKKSTRYIKLKKFCYIDEKMIYGGKFRLF